MSSEDFLCPLERKKHKIATIEREVNEFTVQARHVQDANLKAHDEPSVKNALSSIKVIDVILLRLLCGYYGEFCLGFKQEDTHS